MLEIESLSDSTLRLFLSIDISGSTALKNACNHRKLLGLYFDRKEMLSQLLRPPGNKTTVQEDARGGRFDDRKVEDAAISKPCMELHGFTLNDDEQCIKAVLHDWAREVFDWAEIIRLRLTDFHASFYGQLEKRRCIGDSNALDRHFWKGVGDELLYVFDVTNLTQLHNLIVAFLMVLRDFDKSAVEKNEVIRLKGAGWLAGFPIRNRRIQFKGPNLFTETPRDQPQATNFSPEDCRRTTGGSCFWFTKYPYPRTDYLGPDIDAGFRLAGHSRPGLMVASMELAELLGKIPLEFQQVRGAIVGWKSLKGVWNGSPYPIIWITLPENWEVHYEGQFTDADADSNRLTSRWLRECRNGLKQINNLSRTIDVTRKSLPEDLGVVAPYIIGEEESNPVPPDHRLMLKIIESLYLGDSGPQNEHATKPPDQGKLPASAQEMVDQLADTHGYQPLSSILSRKFEPFTVD